MNYSQKKCSKAFLLGLAIGFIGTNCLSAKTGSQDNAITNISHID